MKLRKHLGVVLEPSAGTFDAGGATFGSVYRDPQKGVMYLYYTGANNEGWTKASIGVAIGSDGQFVKYAGNPLLSFGSQCVTPAVFKIENRYWMVFGFEPKPGAGRRLCLATSEKPIGPWKFFQELIVPEAPWEGNSIDIGPSVADLNGEHLVFYSNVTTQRPSILRKFLRKSAEYLPRRIGVLRMRVSAIGENTHARWERNPLSHLNGQQGTWNESLFCPGYFALDGVHYLLPAGSTYSVGFPYRQYIGLVEASSPFFEKPTNVRPLIDGSKEKNELLSGAKGEIALDTPCPVVLGDRIWLYYSAMDRSDGIWKTLLSVFSTA